MTAPAVIWLRCGNCTTNKLQTILDRHLPTALDMIRSGEPLVEIVDVSVGEPGDDVNTR